MFMKYINVNEEVKNKVELKKDIANIGNSLIDSMYKSTSMGRTENNALTFTRSGSPLLDFFAQGASTRDNPMVSLDLFKKAFAEDKQKAVRILFWIRDVRGGQGERDVFRNCLQWLGEEAKDEFEKVIGLVPEYGRWDDVFFDDDKCFEIIKDKLKEDLEIAIEGDSKEEKEYYENIIQKL